MTSALAWLLSSEHALPVATRSDPPGVGGHGKRCQLLATPGLTDSDDKPCDNTSDPHGDHLSLGPRRGGLLPFMTTYRITATMIAPKTTFQAIMLASKPGMPSGSSALARAVARKTATIETALHMPLFCRGRVLSVSVR